VPGDVAVEAARRPRVRRVGRQPGRDVRPGEVDGVVPQEDPVPVRLVGLAGQVAGLEGRELHAPAQAGEARRQLPAQVQRRLPVDPDREEVDVRRSDPRAAGRDGPVEVRGRAVHRADGVDRGAHHRLERRRHPRARHPGDDRAAGGNTLVRITHEPRR
jgi:hypothetical protein